MFQKFLCKLGIHKWGKAIFIDHAVQSNTRDYRQKCQACFKIRRWVQPKELKDRFFSHK